MIEITLFFLIIFTIFAVLYDKHDYWHKYKIVKEDNKFYPMYQNIFGVWKYYSFVKNKIWNACSFDTEQDAKQWLRKNSFYYD